MQIWRVCSISFLNNGAFLVYFSMEYHNILQSGNILPRWRVLWKLYILTPLTHSSDIIKEINYHKSFYNAFQFQYL